MSLGLLLAQTGDPMLDGSQGWGAKVITIIIVKVLIVFVLGLVGTMFMVWFERKVVSGMHNRIGPNKAGPKGLLQTLADGTKLFFKEDLVPRRADRVVFAVAPFLSLVPAFLTWSVIPLGGNFQDGNDGTFTVAGVTTRAQLIDAPVGILVVLALSSIGVYGVMLAGWSSGSKYPMLGSIRASAQMISYEAALGLSLGAVILMSGTLSTSGIVLAQDRLLNWNVIATGIVPFFIFFIAITAELNRPPFDLVEAEQELVSGFNTEYSSIRFALFFLAEFMNVITMSGIMATLFFGGPQPIEIFGFNLFGWAGGVGGTLWLLLKVLAFLYIYVWMRASLPRFRYDQLMSFGWKLLIPVALLWFLLLAAIEIGRSDGWSFGDDGLMIGILLGVVVIGTVLFTAALDVARRNREREGASS